MLTTLLTACGQPKNSSASATVTPTEQASSTSDTSNSGKTAKTGTIKYAYWGSAVEGKVVQGIVDNYMKENPGVKIDAVHIPDAYDEKITAMIAANQAPDIFYCHEGMAYELAEGGKLFNIYDMVGKDPEFKLEDYVPGVWWEWAPNKLLGRRIGIAASALYYNVDAVKEAGLPPFPTDPKQALSWDEFVNRLKKLTIDANGKRADEPGFDPNNIKQYGLSVPIGDTWMLMSLLNTAGISWSDDTGKVFGLSTPEGIAAVQKIADLFNVYHVAPNPVQSKNLPGADVSLTSKMVAVSLTGNWVCADFAAAGAKFDVGVLPSFGRYSGTIFCGPTVISANTKNIDLTWDFYKYAADPEHCLDFYTSGISIPVKKAWLTDKDKLAKWTNNPQHPAGYVQGMLQPLLDGAKAVPSDTEKNFTAQESIVKAALEPVWLGQKSAQEVLSEIKPKVEAEMQGKYIWQH
jgi:multiple sugar transport system substrate-binding protein